MTVPAALPVLGTYRRLVVAFSGGKDSLAALLHLLDPGVPAHATELHHHDVDGHGPPFMEWRCTPGYVRAIETAPLRTPRLRGIFLCANIGSFANLRNDKLPICN